MPSKTAFPSNAIKSFGYGVSQCQGVRIRTYIWEPKSGRGMVGEEKSAIVGGEGDYDDVDSAYVPVVMSNALI